MLYLVIAVDTWDESPASALRLDLLPRRAMLSDCGFRLFFRLAVPVVDRILGPANAASEAVLSARASDLDFFFAMVKGDV